MRAPVQALRQTSARTGKPGSLPPSTLAGRQRRATEVAGRCSPASVGYFEADGNPLPPYKADALLVFYYSARLVGNQYGHCPTRTRRPRHHRAQAHLFALAPRTQGVLRDFSPDCPGISQSAHTVDAGHFQLETDLFRLRREDEQQESRRSLAWADLTLKVGLTRTLEFHVGFQPRLRERVVPEPGSRVAAEDHARVGDVTLRLKQNLLGNDGGALHVLALSGYARLPTGGAVGAGQPEFGLSRAL